MSRSRRLTPKRGITIADSEKRDKVLAHRKERKRVREVLGKNPEADVLPHRNELSDPWLMQKDGKRYLGHKAAPRDLRK